MSCGGGGAGGAGFGGGGVGGGFGDFDWNGAAKEIELTYSRGERANASGRLIERYNDFKRDFDERRDYEYYKCKG
jgi:hypothetical protein